MKYDIKKMRHLYKQWQSSGLSKIAFCKQQGIRANTFHYWIKKFRTEDPSGSPKRFSQISIIQPIVAEPKQQAVVVINFPSGMSLELFSPVEASYLKDLLQ